MMSVTLVVPPPPGLSDVVEGGGGAAVVPPEDPENEIIPITFGSEKRGCVFLSTIYHLNRPISQHM